MYLYVRGERSRICMLEVSGHVFVCLTGTALHLCVRGERPCICMLELSGFVLVC